MILEDKPSPEEVLEESLHEDELKHYGTKFHSGRYPYGSGDEPYQHSGDFVSRCQELKKAGMKDKEIADHFGMSIQDYRDEYRVANNTRKLLEFDRISNLKEKGYSNYKIAEIMGYSNESTVRTKLKNKEDSVARMKEAQNTCDFLKERMKEKRFIDVGKGAERELNITRDKLDEAIYMMRMEGYQVYKAQRDQPTNPGKKTTYMIVGEPNTTKEEFYENLNSAKIESIKDYKSSDGGQSFQPKFSYPASLDSKRLMVRPAEEGGAEKDGIIELRRGVKDLDLQEARYAQVRILVDNSHYLKGMAVYSDDMPDGVDVVFNSNKSIVDKPDKLDHLKSIDKHVKIDPTNPFGTAIKDMEEGGQYYYTDASGKKQLGLINKKSNAGDWKEWSNALPSQFLAKQPLSLAKKQIDLALEKRKADFDEICSLTNPTIKKKLLEDFAGDCDSAAVHLKAASLPRQQYHAIIPINTLKETEVYAPNYEDGEKVALVRFPHAGTFEIPILTVNNKNKLGRDTIGSEVDAVGINYKTGEQLSGADFDGDTVMVIPCKGNNIKATHKLKELEGFDPKIQYATHKKVVNGKDKYFDDNDIEVNIMKNTNTQMGVISNLITDMTLYGAPPGDIAKAVKHSMVVIDAEKHKLNWQQSEKDNDIKTLKQIYQGGGGASTLISQAKAEDHVTKTQGQAKWNKKGTKDYDPSKPEGAVITKEHKDAYTAEWFVDKDNPDIRGYVLKDGKTKVSFNKNDPDAVEYYKPVKVVDEKTGKVRFTNKTGELEYNVNEKTQKTTRMANTDDAYTLLSDKRWPMELLYADYANKLKAMANQARKEYLYTGETKKDPAATKLYAEEVASLEAKLNTSAKNAPRERMAIILANTDIKAKQADNPDITPKELKKIRDQAMKRARESVGAKRHQIEITDKEWEAIQAGAITKTKLWEILRFADMDILRARAMPRDTSNITTAQKNRIVAKFKTGKFTYSQIANSVDMSTNSIISLLKEEGLL